MVPLTNSVMGSQSDENQHCKIVLGQVVSEICLNPPTHHKNSMKP